MTEAVPFTDNVRDLSNADGYQFEFRCERCGNGYRSAFQRDLRETGQSLARGLGNLLGGRFSQLSSAADQLLDRGTNSAAKDRAMRQAVGQIADRFHQCRGCGDWVCGDVCWNDEIGQCVRCSPVLAEQLAQLQAEARRAQISERLGQTDLTAGIDLRTPSVARCPSCGAQSGGGKFCQECGGSLAAERTCTSCSATNPVTAKFCSECGTPSGP
ncbi:zinc ribbon domain-containing protein [Cellulomonas iranensis]|uniref:zinc ribbon domain-containing protein n=1 Tax=Cellulomonas iranensis TaxID=76862 RepID=UPI001969DAB0|nr:zinc ribbon domain-containing protein [Cellulomonas iranensis]